MRVKTASSSASSPASSSSSSLLSASLLSAAVWAAAAALAAHAPAAAAAPAAGASGNPGAAASASKAPQKAADGTVYLAPRVMAPYGARTRLVISLEPDEGRCQALYGDEWRQRCRAAVGRYGAPAAGVRLSPALEGRWEWESANSLAFIPYEDWPAGQKYRVSLAALPTPLRAELTATGLDVETPPLTATVVNAAFWADPKPEGERLATFEFSFSTVPDRAAVEKSFSLSTDGKAPAKGLRLGAPAFIWNAAGDVLFVKAKIEQLPDEPAVIWATIANAAGRAVQKDGRFTVPKGAEKAAASLSIPSASTIFRVERASVSAVKTARLDDVYEVRLKTTLATTPGAVLDAIKIYALPKKLSDEAASDANWSQAPVIDAEILAKATRIIPEAADGLDDAGSDIRLRLKAPAGTFLYLTLPKGFGEGKATLAQDWKSVLLLPRLDAQVRFMQPGSLLTLAGTKALSLYGTGVEEIRWRIARVRDEYLALSSQSWRALSSPAPDSYVEAASGKIALGASKEGEARFASIDLAKAAAEAGPGLYRIDVTGWRQALVDEKPAMQQVASATKQLLLTNTALIVKGAADGSRDVFAADFRTGKPIADAAARLLAANGTVIEETRTDAFGRARFRSANGLERERRPAAIVTKTAEGDLAWLSLSDGSNVSNLAQWEAAGRLTGPDSLAAAAFADRGVYRAGETAHFGAIVKRVDWAPLAAGATASNASKAPAAGLPLLMRLTDSAGRVVAERTAAAPADGLLSLDWPIPKDQLPGRLRLDLLVPESDAVLSTASIVVEDFAPETLSLEAALPPELAKSGWVKPEKLSVPLTLKSLYGAGMEGRRIEARLTLAPAGALELDRYKDYAFPAAGGAAGGELTMDDIRTAGDGSAAAELDLPRLGLEGWQRATLSLSGFEAEGGRAATKTLSFIVSNADAILGWRLLGTPQPLRWLEAGRAAELEAVAVGQNLEPLARKPLQASFAKQRYVTELASDATGKPQYRESPVSEPVKTVALETDASGRVRLPLETALPGDWLVTIRDDAGKTLLELPYHLSGNELKQGLSPTLPAAEVRASADKASYEAGETARVSILSPFEGFGLLTLESRGVDALQWITVKPGQNEASIAIPEGVSGRAYLHLSLIRGQRDANRFLEGYAETVMPVSVARAPHELGITLDVPETSPDGRAVPVTVSASEPSRLFLWAADDGILSLTDYQTPDPAKAILDDRALQVETRQVLDKLMPDASAIAGALAPFGGDFEAALKSAAGRAAMENPFRRRAEASAVWWGGVVEAGPEPKTVMMTLPEGFAGRVRVMAAGASLGRVGAADAPAVVRPPLAIEPMLPRAVAPGDVFRAAAAVSPAEDLPGGSGRLEIAAPTGFAPLTAMPLALAFGEAGGASAAADFTAPMFPMTAEFVFRAEAAPAAPKAAPEEAAAEAPAEASVEAPVDPAAPEAAPSAAAAAANPTDPAAPAAELAETTAADDAAAPAAAPQPVKPALSAERRASLSVRPASLPKTRLFGGRFKTDKTSYDITAGSPLYPVGERTVFTVTALPLPLAAELARPFADAPWASVLDRIAAAMPYALLAQRPEAAVQLGVDPSSVLAEAAKRQDAAVAAISRAAGWDGLKLFPGLSSDLFLTAFAEDYLLTAGTYGGVPVELAQRLAQAIARATPGAPLTMDEARTAAYAIWVLTREGEITTSRIEGLRALMDERFPEWKKDPAAIFLAGAYQILRLKDEADALLKGRISTARAGYPWSPESAAALAAAVFPASGLADHPQAKFWQRLMLDDLESTLASGAALSPVYAAAAGRAAVIAGEAAMEEEGAAGPAGVTLACTKRAPGFPTDQDVLTQAAGSAKLAAPGCLAYRASLPSGSLRDWFWQASQTGSSAAPQTAARSSGISISREYVGADGRAATEFQTGELVTVRIRLRSFLSASGARGTLDDVAVTDLLPGGFELADPPGTGPAGAKAFMRAEDRMQFIAPEMPLGEATVTYRVRAVTPGIFAAPPAEAASISSPSVQASGVSGRITIH